MAPLTASIVLSGTHTPVKEQVERFEHIDGFYELDPREVHPLHAAAKPSREALQKAASTPVIVTPNPMVRQQVLNGLDDPAQSLPINSSAFSVDTPTFKGMVEVHLKGLPNTHDGIFEGKKRFFQIMVQGRFKRPVAASALCMGQEFVKAPANLKPWMSELLLTAAAKIFSSSTQVDIKAALPYFMNPILAACQLVNVSQPGSEPQLAEATEDMRLFSDALADKKGNPVTGDKRRKWCDTPKNLVGKQFDTDHVYTLHIWQHLIDFSTYNLNLGGLLNLDLTHFLNSQPLQLTCKDTAADEYMFSMLVWHQKLLYGDNSSSRAASFVDKLSKFSFGLQKQLLGSVQK